MASAVSSTLHVRARRRAASRHRCVIFKALIVGLGGLAIAFTTIVIAMTGLGRMYGVSLQGRPDVRSIATLAAPADQRVLAALAAGELVIDPVVVAGYSPPETTRSAETRTLDVTAAKASDDSPDEIYTSSIDPILPAPAESVVTSVALSASSPPIDDAPLLPLPRAKPRLAALPPAGDLGIGPEGESSLHRTAVYDITAQTVYLPSGERLEAHSGLGDLMDDPRHVHRKMRGATPPNVYKLTMREALFHGVRALRMTPVGEGRMYNRDGILAHSYMLGPNGQSNGCISFKDYPKFLRAYLRGEIDRIVVVARLAKPPAFYARSNVRSASNAL